jgi:hypothetical protein
MGAQIDASTPQVRKFFVAREQHAHLVHDETGKRRNRCENQQGQSRGGLQTTAGSSSGAKWDDAQSAAGQSPIRNKGDDRLVRGHDARSWSGHGVA